MEKSNQWKKKPIRMHNTQKKTAMSMKCTQNMTAMRTMKTDEIETRMEMETDHHQLQMNKMKSTSSSRSTIKMFSTESGLTVVLPEICHNSVNTSSPGFSAYMEICLLIFKEFVQDTIVHLTSLKQD